MNTFDEVDILLVEDNPDDAEVVLRSLKNSRIANGVEWVKDGAAALDFLFRRGEYQNRNSAHRLKLVLLDLKLPKVDGLEVLKSIRSEERTRNIPVVVLTSSTQDEDMVRSYRLGVNSYVAKPVMFERFSEVVTQLGLYWMLVNRTPDAA